MKNRNDILCQALDECLYDMYKWSQPSIDLKELIDSGYTFTKEDKIYDRHYLSEENYKYIKDNYVYAYGMKDSWKDNFETLLSYLIEGGLKDKWIERDGDQPGYRGYEKLPPLKDFIGEENTDKAISLIKECRDFYYHDREENNFGINLALYMPSPTSNKEMVEKYWKEHDREDFSINDFKIDDVIYGGVNDEYIDITEDEFIETLK